MSTLPGAEVRKNDVHFSVRPDEVDDTFEVIEQIKAWADGETAAP